MKHLLLFSFFIVFSLCSSQQTGQTFIVKKRPVENKSGFQRIFDLKLGGVGDTICGSVYLDLSPAVGYYDSISLVNLRIMDKVFLDRNRRYYVTTSKNGHAIITFFKKQKDGTSKMVYFRNWVIHCLERFPK